MGHCGLASLPVAAYDSGCFLSRTKVPSQASRLFAVILPLYIGIGRGTPALIAFVVYLRRRKTIVAGSATETAVVDWCRAALAWGAAFICLFAWKKMYDLGQLPYPFHAYITGNWDQMVTCLDRLRFRNHRRDYGVRCRHRGAWIGRVDQHGRADR